MYYTPVEYTFTAVKVHSNPLKCQVEWFVICCFGNYFPRVMYGVAEVVQPTFTQRDFFSIETLSKRTFINCMFQILLWYRSCCCTLGEIKLVPYRFLRKITHILAWKNLVEQRSLATTWIQSNYVRKPYKRLLNIRFPQKPQMSHRMGDVFVRKKKFKCPNRICFFDNCHNRYFRLLMKFAREKIDITEKRQTIMAMVWKWETFIEFQELLSQYWIQYHFAPSKITKEHTKLLGDNL